MPCEPRSEPSDGSLTTNSRLLYGIEPNPQSQDVSHEQRVALDRTVLAATTLLQMAVRSQGVSVRLDLYSRIVRETLSSWYVTIFRS